MNAPVQSNTPEQDNRQTQAIIEIRAHIIQVPEIIKDACEELDIAIELQEQKQGRQRYTGKSQTGRMITIEASSFEKGRTLIKIGVEGDDEAAKVLMELVDKAIEKRIENTNPPPEWTL